MAGEARNWLELPLDVMTNILCRIGVVDILENAQNVCTTWRKLCKDPVMWRVIEMEFLSGPYTLLQFEKMCMHAVHRSEGQLVDISIVDFGSAELLRYITDRSSQLRRLKITRCPFHMSVGWPEALKKIPLLEELSLYKTFFSKEAIEAAGHYCPMLKTLKVNHRTVIQRYTDVDTEAIAIAENLTELRHLELIGNTMSNTGLQVILDSCRHLESLDLRNCENINLNGYLGKRCSEQIKYLRLPNDTLDGSPYMFGFDPELYDGDDDDYDRFDDDYDRFNDDDYDGFNDDDEYDGFNDDYGDYTWYEPGWYP